MGFLTGLYMRTSFLATLLRAMGVRGVPFAQAETRFRLCPRREHAYAPGCMDDE